MYVLPPSWARFGECGIIRSLMDQLVFNALLLALEVPGDRIEENMLHIPVFLTQGLQNPANSVCFAQFLHSKCRKCQGFCI